MAHACSELIFHQLCFARGIRLFNHLDLVLPLVDASFTTLRLPRVDVRVAFLNDSANDASEEERLDNTENPFLEIFMLPRCSLAIQQWKRDEEICLVALSCHFGLDVIFWSMEY